MLAVSRRLNEARKANKQPSFSYERLRSFDLKNKILGVVGTGRIGLRVAHIALAFGMQVIAYEPYRQSLMAEIRRREIRFVRRIVEVFSCHFDT